jgi:REP element-mobilizing transposase RayT
MDKYRNQYRTTSTRLQNWNYGWNGAYFITLCCKNQCHCFGEISEGKMQLSAIGVIADVLWYEIKNHAKDIILGEFIVMPNHIHGIVVLENADGDSDSDADDVETRHALSLQPQPQTQPQPQSIGQKRFQNQGKNTLSSIIGSYKSAVTKHAHRLDFDFLWQPRFYDHIIRNEKSYHQIADYIKNNPAKWDMDKLNGGIGNKILEPSPEYGLEVWMV